MKARERWLTASTYVILIVYVFVTLLPLVWMMLISIKPKKDLWQDPPVIIPSAPTTKNYVLAFKELGVGSNLMNSLKIALGSLLVSIPVSTLAAYGFARWTFKGKTVLLVLILGTQMIPGMASLVPLFSILQSLQLLDTYLGLILVFAAQTVPLNIWILKGFFEAIPDEVMDAASVDGCTSTGVLYRIVLPLAKPGFAAAALFTVMRSWNDFVVALTMLFSDNKMTFPPSLYKLYGSPIMATNYGAMFAAATGGAIPIILLFILFQRYFIRGLTAGAVKA